MSNTIQPITIAIKNTAIIDVIGQCVMQQKAQLFTGSLVLDIAHLNTGVYVVKAQDGNGKE